MFWSVRFNKGASVIEFAASSFSFPLLPRPSRTLLRAQIFEFSAKVMWQCLRSLGDRLRTEGPPTSMHASEALVMHDSTRGTGQEMHIRGGACIRQIWCSHRLGGHWLAYTCVLRCRPSVCWLHGSTGCCNYHFHTTYSYFRV